MIRKAIRILLPATLRRPLTDWVYGCMAWISGRITRLSGRIARDPSLIHIPYVIVKNLADSLLWTGWTRLAAYRHLISVNYRSLSPIDRVRKRILTFFLALPDPFYKLQFRHFDSWRKSFYEGYPDASEKTRVSSFIGTLGPGGAERQLTNTLIGLATDSRLELGLYCQSLSVASHRFFLPDIRVAGINVFDLTRLTHTAEESGIAAVWPIGLEGSIQFAAALRQERPHIAHFWLDECNIKGGLAALAEGIPKIILSLRSLPPINFSLHRPYMREGYRYLARQKSVILVSNSYAGAGAYEKWLGLERGRVKVIHNGLNFNVAALFSIKASRNRIRSELGLDSAIPVVGLVSRLSEEKRPLLWLEIAACVRQQLPDVKFLIAGDGVQMQLVRERATKADLCGSVVLLPHRSDPLAIMAAMDVFLLTSRLEGLPNVLIEAQALGIPVIAPKVGGIPETFEDGVTGRLFECSDPHDVARLTIEVLRDTDWRSLVATKGPSITQKKFAIDRMIRETRNLYEFK